MLPVRWEKIVHRLFSSSHRRRGTLPTVGIERLETRSLMSASGPVVTESTTLHGPDEIPQLASNPSAFAKLYLDFDGNFEAQWGSHRDVTSPVFSLEADRTTISNWELATIQDVWAAVAEDFAPFNIDVTTIEPADFNNGHALRVVIGGSPNDWYGSSCAGVSFTNSFTSSQPNVDFVFSEYGWPDRNQANYLADLVSHEAGHAFGLSHQAQYAADGSMAVFTVSTNVFGANLVVQAELQNVTSQTLVTAVGNDTDPACLQANLPAGDYLVVVSSNGEYGSVGQYSLTGAVTAESIVAPQAATNLTASSKYGYRHELTWTAVVDAVGYRVFRRARSGAAETLIETLPTGTTQALIAVSRTPFSTQSDWWFSQYRVEAFNASGAASTAWQQVTHQFGVPSQTRQLDLQALSGTAVRLTWQADPTSQFQKVVVMQYLDQSATRFFYERTLLLGVDQTEVTLDGLIPGTRYSFAVVGVNPAGRSGATYQFAMPHPDAPAAPVVQMTLLPGRIVDLTWNSVPGATGYYVSMLSSRGTWRMATLSSTATSFQVTGLSYDTPYRFIVEAVNASGATATVTASLTIPYLPPSVPSGFRVGTLAQTSVLLRWYDTTTETGYRLYQTTAGVESLIATLPANTVQYQVNYLTKATTYQFRLVAFHGGGASSTGQLIVTTLPDRPTPIQNFTAVVSGPNSVKLAWNDSTGETQYRVYMGVGTTGPVSLYATLPANTTSYTVSGLSSLRVYRFYIVAINAVGSIASVWQTVTMP